MEDDLPSAHALTMILSRRQWTVIIAKTVAEGLTMLDRNPGFVILDLMLPDGDGMQILQYIRAAKLPISVLVTTAVTDPERLRTVHSLNPSAVLRKPIDLVQLFKGLGQTT